MLGLIFPHNWGKTLRSILLDFQWIRRLSMVAVWDKHYVNPCVSARTILFNPFRLFISPSSSSFLTCMRLSIFSWILRSSTNFQNSLSVQFSPHQYSTLWIPDAVGSMDSQDYLLNLGTLLASALILSLYHWPKAFSSKLKFHCLFPIFLGSFYFFA